MTDADTPKARGSLEPESGHRSSPHLDQITPGAKTIGRRIVAIDAGAVRLSFAARPEFANRHGTVGGGFLAAMLDSATAAPLLAELPDDRTAVTVRLDVHFLKPAPLGEIDAIGRIAGRDDRDVDTVAELMAPDGTVVARAQARLRIVRKR